VPGDDSFIANGFVSHNSADMIQSLLSMGINAEGHTVRKQDYDTLQTAIYDGRIRGFWNEQLVENELLKLKLINNNKIDHPTTGEKDMADALAGAVFMCMNNMTEMASVDLEFFYDSPEEGNAAERISRKEVVPREIPSDLKEWLLSML
jgi:hypothetical protein